MFLPQRNTDALVRGRVSLTGARYFITICAVRPVNMLRPSGAADAVLATLRSVICGEVGHVSCCTVMPDHVHVLLELGARLQLGQVVGKIKTRSRPILDRGGARWQRNFFEHRLRPDESVDAYARYIYLNPYRANLLNRRDVWPWWHRGDAVFDFVDMMEEGRYPPPAWLDEPVESLGLAPENLGVRP